MAKSFPGARGCVTVARRRKLYVFRSAVTVASQWCRRMVVCGVGRSSCSVRRCATVTLRHTLRSRLSGHWWSSAVLCDRPATVGRRCTVSMCSKRSAVSDGCVRCCSTVARDRLSCGGALHSATVACRRRL